MYVQATELAKQLGKPSLTDVELVNCCQEASDLIDDWTGWETGHFNSPTVPAGIHRIALSLSVDLWKQPDATFGIAGMGETGPVRIARDLVARYDSLLIPYYNPANGWGVA
jgi:hypothetical protein